MCEASSDLAVNIPQSLLTHFRSMFCSAISVQRSISISSENVRKPPFLYPLKTPENKTCLPGSKNPERRVPKSI